MKSIVADLSSLNSLTALPKRGASPLLCVALGLLLPGAALAQTGISEADVIQEEKGEEEVSEEAISLTERDALATRPTVNLTAPGVDDLEGDSIYSTDLVQFKLRAVSRLFGVDNVDFRALSDTDDNIQDQFDSDDRRFYGSNNAVVNVAFTPSEQLALNLGMRHNSLWGGGKFFNLNSDNVLFVDNLFIEWKPVQVDAFEMTTRIGRQYFEIGGAGDFGGARRDYFFWDVVDGLTVDFDFRAIGKLRVLAVDFAGAQYRPDEVDFYTRQLTPTSNVNFRGQAATQRYGAVYENTEVLDGLEVRAFGFFADIGAGSNRADGTAGDLCYGGQLCNYTDNDYNWMAGARAGYFFEDDAEKIRVGGYGEYARSGGLDRKDTRVGLYDVPAEGDAFGGGLLADFDLGSISLGAASQYFRADGPSYSSVDGVLFNHGFVGFKGAHVGGGIADDTLGWHPSAYVSATNGVDQTPQDQQRKSGTQSIYAGGRVGALEEMIDVRLGAWFFQSLGNFEASDEDVNRIAEDLPFGYTLADLQAQQRLGKRLGTELDAGVSVKAYERVNVFGQGALFLPGEFYQGEISRTGGTALGSDDPVNAWMVSAGISMELQ